MSSSPGTLLSNNQEMQQILFSSIGRGRGSVQKTPPSQTSLVGGQQTPNDDAIHMEASIKERHLSPREMHLWRKSLFTVYIGRLPVDTELRELAELFKSAGTIKDGHICPPNDTSLSGFTYGFLRYGTLDEAQHAVSTMNGRVFGNRHIVVELASQTRVSLSPTEKENDEICHGRDRLLRRDYPTVRRRSFEENDEGTVKGKVLAAIAKLKSADNSPSFLQRIEDILKKVAEVPGETSTFATTDEGPACTLSSMTDFQPTHMPSQTNGGQVVQSGHGSLSPEPQQNHPEVNGDVHRSAESTHTCNGSSDHQSNQSVTVHNGEQSPPVVTNVHQSNQSVTVHNGQQSPPVVSNGHQSTHPARGTQSSGFNGYQPSQTMGSSSLQKSPHPQNKTSCSDPESLINDNKTVLNGQRPYQQTHVALVPVSPESPWDESRVVGDGNFSPTSTCKESPLTTSTWHQPLSIESKPGYQLPPTEAKPVYQLPSTEPKPGYQLPSTEPKQGYQLPSTEAKPVYQLPSTEAKPVYQLPSTDAKPVYQLPSTEPKQGYQLPSTEAKPGYQHPSTEAKPVYQHPSTEAKPVYQHPSTEAKPVYQPPSTEAKPVYQHPSTEAKPVYQHPSTEAKPVYQHPSTEAKPVYQLPSTEAKPVYQHPSTEPKPVYQPPSTEAKPGYQLPSAGFTGCQPSSAETNGHQSLSSGSNGDRSPGSFVPHQTSPSQSSWNQSPPTQPTGRQPTGHQSPLSGSGYQSLQSSLPVKARIPHGLEHRESQVNGGNTESKASHQDPYLAISEQQIECQDLRFSPKKSNDLNCLPAQKPLRQTESNGQPCLSNDLNGKIITTVSRVLNNGIGGEMKYKAPPFNINHPVQAENDVSTRESTPLNCSPRHKEDGQLSKGDVIGKTQDASNGSRKEYNAPPFIVKPSHKAENDVSTSESTPLTNCSPRDKLGSQLSKGDVIGTTQSSSNGSGREMEYRAPPFNVTPSHKAENNVPSIESTPLAKCSSRDKLDGLLSEDDVIGKTQYSSNGSGREMEYSALPFNVKPSHEAENDVSTRESTPLTSCSPRDELCCQLSKDEVFGKTKDDSNSSGKEMGYSAPLFNVKPSHNAENDVLSSERILLTNSRPKEELAGQVSDGLVYSKPKVVDNNNTMKEVKYNSLSSAVERFFQEAEKNVPSSERTPLTNSHSNSEKITQVRNPLEHTEPPQPSASNSIKTTQVCIVGKPSPNDSSSFQSARRNESESSSSADDLPCPRSAVSPVRYSDCPKVLLLENLKLTLQSIQKGNKSLQVTMNQDKKTSELYPDQDRLKLRQEIHLKEVLYQKAVERTVASNAENELLYEREKLSAGYDMDLQKELDIELQIEVMKNDIKLAEMDNELLICYRRLNDMQ